MSFPLGYSFFNYFYLSQLAGFQEAKIKTRFYAGILVSQGPSGTYGVGWMRRRGRVPDGLPHRSPDRDAARNATVTGTGDLTGATFVGH